MRLALYDNSYRAFRLPEFLRNITIHSSRLILSKRLISQLRSLSNSVNLSFPKYDSEYKNSSISRSAVLRPYFDLTKYRMTRQYFK